MTRGVALLALMGTLVLSSCAKKENPEQAAKPTTEAPAATQPPPQAVGGPHASVQLKNGNKVPGTIVASSQTDMVVSGDDGIEHKIPLSQIKSVEYGETAAKQPVERAYREPAPRKTPPREGAAAAAHSARRAPSSSPPCTGGPATSRGYYPDLRVTSRQRSFSTNERSNRFRNRGRRSNIRCSSYARCKGCQWRHRDPAWRESQHRDQVRLEGRTFSRRVRLGVGSEVRSHQRQAISG